MTAVTICYDFSQYLPINSGIRHANMQGGIYSGKCRQGLQWKAKKKS